ncbi:MAG: RibD family protein, partial [Mariprofundus sp.]
RAECDAIIVGAGTLQHDNPSLTVRDTPVIGNVPMRVVLCFATPPFDENCKLLSDDAPSRFYVRGMNEHTQQWQDAGVQIEQAGSLLAILKHLADDGFLQILLEGGGALHASFLEAGFTDELVLYQAPIMIGGRDAVALWNGRGVETVDSAIRLADVQRRILGDDQMIRGRLAYPESPVQDERNGFQTP